MGLFWLAKVVVSLFWVMVGSGGFILGGGGFVLVMVGGGRYFLCGGG